MNYFETAAGQDAMESIARSLHVIAKKLDDSRPTEKTFAVCISSGYVRDAQYFNPTDMSDTEFAKADFHDCEHEDKWCDISPCVLIDITKAASPDDAVERVAERKGFDKRVLYAFEVK